MADPNNGVYLISADGARYPLRRDVLFAIRRFIDNKLTGTVTINFKQGGISSVEDRTVYQTGN